MFISADQAREMLVVHERMQTNWQLSSHVPPWVAWELRAGIRIVQRVLDDGVWFYKYFLCSDPQTWTLISKSEWLEEVVAAV